MANRFDIHSFQNYLKTKEIGKHIIYHDITGSTMDDARELAIKETQNYPHGTVVMTERQTKGRGARNHTWDSPNSGNIYVSIVLHMPQKFKTFDGRFEVEVMSCLAVIKAAKKFGVSEAIPKWPNDVWVRGHKLSGNLVEDCRFNIPGTPSCLLVLGVGINVNTDLRRNAELHSIATSIMCENHGKQISREELFATFCLSLEEYLAESRAIVLKIFRDENLFQKGCDISVTCPSEGKVINGEFYEICENWEISFIDKRTKEIMCGRSDYFTMRPKVGRKILVVFTGISGSRSASVLSKWLISVVDTSKFVVCLVPETTMTESDEWMKTCDLLVLVDGIHDLGRVTPRLKSYLKRGGRLFASGAAASFVAKFMDIPMKECLSESTGSNSDIHLVYLDHDDPISEVKTIISASGESRPIAFLASKTCFKFSQKYLKEESATASSTSAFLSLSGEQDFGALSLSDKDSTAPPAASKKNIFSLRYSSIEDPEYNIAMFVRPTTSGGVVALFGFDIGAVFPSSALKTGSDDQGDGKREKTEKESKMESDIQRLSDDCFRRDEIILNLLKNLNP